MNVRCYPRGGVGYRYALLVMVLLVGCQGPLALAPAVHIDQSSPRSLMESFDRAELAEDLDGLVVCMVPDSRRLWRKHLTYALSAASQAEALVGIVEARFGPAMAQELSDTGIGGALRRTRLSEAREEGVINWEEMSITEEGDVAELFCTEPRWHVLSMVRLDDVWYIDPDGPGVEISTAEEVRWYRDYYYNPVIAFCKHNIRGIQSGAVTEEDFREIVLEK